MKKVGIFGGTFNPVHTAHLIMAESTRDQLNLDKILFIPCADPPHKNADNLINANIRIEMTSLAVKGNPFFEVSDIEIELSKTSKSYTINTLTALNEKYKDEQVKFYLIIGMDQLIELHTWKDPAKLLQLAEVVVINRPGFLANQVNNDYGKHVTLIPVPNIDISSTEIRRRVRENKSIKYLVPEAVEKFITEHKIYKQN